MRQISSLCFAVALALSAAPAWAGIFDDPQNLEVLPDDTPPEVLRAEMREFAMGLGVRCGHCHVGDEGAPLSEYDFASDEKDAKLIARAMMRMVAEINEDHIGELDSDGPHLQVTCGTCHSGKRKPWTLAQRMDLAYAEGGASAALLEHAALREAHHGGREYDFSEWSLIRYADTLQARGDLAGAAAVLAVNLEHFPGSFQTRMSLAGVAQAAGDVAAARTHLDAALAIQPGDPRALQMKAALDGG